MLHDDKAWRQLRDKLRSELPDWRNPPRPHPDYPRAREVWSRDDDQLFTLAYQAWLASGGPDER